jgi:hypothetical protein
MHFLDVAALAIAAAAPLEHRAVACVTPDRYTRISARAAAPVAGAELQFRAGQGDWYAVRMTAQGETWSGMLPRPQPRLERFEYRLAATDAKAEVSYSSMQAVTVGMCPEPGDTAAEVAEPIVVRVPEGAPLVPPVPAGFSPAGVVAAERPANPSAWRKVAWIGGAAAAAAVGAAASGATSSPPEVPEAPEFAIAAITPPSGSDVSASGDPITVLVDVRGEPREPLTFTWVAGLRSAGASAEPCLLMTGVASIGRERPLTLALTGPLRRRGFCGNTYTTTSLTVTIIVEGRVARELMEDVALRIGL